MITVFGLFNLALGLLATAAALALAAAWLISGQIVRRRRPDPPDTPGDRGLPFEHVTFGARDGVQLGGWLTGPPGSRRPAVIFCPGLFGSMDGDTHFLPAFAAAGFDVLQFDWRAHGISDGERVSLGVREIDDALGAIDFLQARGVTRIGLLGFSMGGAVALRAAARDARVACVVCDGGFVRVRRAIEAFLRRRIGPLAGPAAGLILWLAGRRLGGIDLRRADPLPEVGRISPRPVLLIHGERDPFVPPADQDAIFAACGEPKALWRVPGAGHRQAHEIARADYEARVIGFFTAHLRG